MALQWKSYMQGDLPTQEIRKFLDEIFDSPLAFAALLGTPDWPFISTTRVQVTGYTANVESRGFAGLTDPIAGTIEIPETGVYQVSGTLGGNLNGFTDISEIILFIRPSGRADIGPITAFTLQPNRGNFIGLPFHFVDQFNKGEQVSLQLDATADINDLFIITYANFEIAQRVEEGFIVRSSVPDPDPGNGDNGENGDDQDDNGDDDDQDNDP